MQLGTMLLVLHMQLTAITYVRATDAFLFLSGSRMFLGTARHEDVEELRDRYLHLFALASAQDINKFLIFQTLLYWNSSCLMLLPILQLSDFPCTLCLIVLKIYLYLSFVRLRVSNMCTYWQS